MSEFHDEREVFYERQALYRTPGGRNGAIDRAKLECQKAHSDEYYERCADAPRLPLPDLEETLVEVVRSRAPRPEDLRHILLARLYAAKHALHAAALCVPAVSNEAVQIAKARGHVAAVLVMLGGDTE